MSERAMDALLRDLAPRLLAVLVRRYGDFATCEDAAQEALVAAATTWPRDGTPTNPIGWLITTSSRRLVEIWRAESARRRREEAYARTTAAPTPPGSPHDDTLPLFFLCCHPVLTQASQVALTLRALGGLTTAEIARALLIPEPTVGQRISRAKTRIRAAGGQFHEPSGAEVSERLPAVLDTLYLIFNEGYTASSGPALQRVELSAEAIRLTRQLQVRVPEDGEVGGLLALMLLTDARRPARTDADGQLIPLADQDRALWDAGAIAEGTQILTRVLATAVLGRFQLQAAIAAVHDEAATAEETDWPQILALYDAHAALTPGPMVTLNRLVAVAKVHGPRRALTELDRACTDPALVGHYRVDVVRAHLLELLGDRDGAREHYRRAAQLTLSLPERSHLRRQADYS